MLEVNVSQLLRRRLVINKGYLGGVQLGTARENSGASLGGNSKASSPSWTNKIIETGEQWFAQTAEKLGTKIECDLRSVELGKSIMSRRPEEYSKLETDVTSVRDRGRQLVEVVKQTKQNPLQPIEHYQQLPASFELLRRDATGMRERLVLLQRQMQMDRAAIEDAKQYDVRYLQQHVQLTNLDPEDFSNYLLGPELGPMLPSSFNGCNGDEICFPSKLRRLRHRLAGGMCFHRE